MRPTITAFAESPDKGQGLARDMRVRWALEEVGQPYDVQLVTFAEMKQHAHLARQPFGQIPTYQEGSLVLFETGAILLHIATNRAGLMPKDDDAQARATCWLFAALNTVEPPIVDHDVVTLLEADEPYHAARLKSVEGRIRDRLTPLATWLGNAEWLDGAFSIGDLMMVSVLLRIRGAGVIEAYPTLMAYLARGEDRPAYRRAFAAQRAVYEASRVAHGQG